jgi:hypothetical protein
MHAGGTSKNDKKAVSSIATTLNEAGLSDAFTVDNGGKGIKFNVDTSKPTEVVNFYESLQQSLRDMEAAGLEETDTYREISEELNLMAESYSEAKL